MNPLHTILIVDDDALIINTLKRRFGGFGIEVYTANTPSETREILEKIIPEVIILDLLLTQEDGSEAIMDYVKSEDRFKNIPIIILTNLDKPELKEMLLAQGAKEYLIKGSMSIDEIYDKIIGYLEPNKIDKIEQN
jgi:DNA-binding response OmpR family regulator